MSSDSGSFEFNLDYSGTKNLAIGEYVCSKNFSAGGHRWRIICYPRGYSKEDNGEYLGIYLQLMSESKNVRAIFDASMKGRDGEPSSSHESCVKVFPPEGYDSWGHPQFVKRSDLESRYVTDGRATIVCVVTVDPLEVPPSDIGRHLGRLLDSADGSDVSFLVGGEEFPAHRVVLAARSTVFKALLLGSMADARMASITLHDIAPATFKVMLRFIYTDDLHDHEDKYDNELGGPTAEMVQDLLAAADRYALDRLKLLCARKLWDNVSVDRIGVTLACAEMYHCPELKKKCIDFFANEKNFKKVGLTDGFVQLVYEFPSVLAELREKVGA